MTTNIVVSELYPIAEGPGKFDLMNALFTKGCTVTFTVRGFAYAEQLTAKITSVQQEDGSCESWNLKGIIEHPTIKQREHFHAYYATSHRKGQAGTIKLVFTSQEEKRDSQLCARFEGRPEGFPDRIITRK